MKAKTTQIHVEVQVMKIEQNWFQHAFLDSCTVATHEHFEMDTQNMV